VGWDQGLFQASFSTVYRILKERNLMTAPGPSRPHNGHSKAPVRKALTGPNQRWCWDISYLLTGQKGEYLYLLLDEWSRKVSGPTSSSIDAVRNLPSAAGAGKKTKSRKPAHENKQNNNNARRPCSVITPRLRSLIQKRAVPQKQLNGLVVSKATPPGNITRE
jgi:hypothetical protein